MWKSFKEFMEKVKPLKEEQKKKSQKFKKIRERLAGSFFFLFLAVIIVALLVIHRSPYTLFGGSANSACYLLSALAQSQAAIVAIVVTLTLVAVQLASQTYSPRVMDLFLKSFAFWILLLFYGLSIMYDFILLDMITEGNINSFSCLVNFGVVLMAGTFSALFLYVKETIEQLKPDAIIDRLGGDVRKELKSFVEAVHEKYKGSENNYSPRMLKEKEDKILSLIDITKKAIRVDDLTTARYGIEKLRDICSDIVRSDEFKSEQKEVVVKHFTEHFIRISHVAFIQDDEDSVIEVVDSLGKIGENAIERRWGNVPEDIKIKYRGEKRGISPEELKGYGMEYFFDRATENIAYVLKEMGDEVIEKGWTSATQSAANAFATLYAKAKEERSYPISDDVILNTCFAPFIVSSMKKDMDFAVEHTIKSFKDAFVKIIGMDLYPNEYMWPKEIVEESIHIIANERDTWKRGHWRKEILNYLIEIGIKAEKAKSDFEDIKGAKEILRNEMRKQISYVVEGIEKVKYNFPDITTTGGEWLGVISDIRDACLDVCSDVYWGYKIEKPEEAFEWILNCMIDTGVKTTNKGLYGSATKVIDYLVDIAIKGKERVIENVFDTYPPVDPIDLDAFEKLEERYKSELEKQKQEKGI